MSVSFGVGTLNVLRNLQMTGVTAAAANSSGTNISNIQVNSGLVMIDGVEVTVSAQSGSFFTEAGATGAGLLVYAYVAAGDTTTATIGVYTAAHPNNTATNINTAIAPLYRFDYGTGSAGVGNFVLWSGGTATKAIGKVQNVSINVTYEQAQMRGGSDIFPIDTQHFDGVVEGSFEFSDPTATHQLFLGGVYVSGGSSGTWSLSGTSRPERLAIQFQNVTDGITATYTIPRAYLSSQTNDFSRTEYLNPSFNFIAQSNYQGDILKIQS